MEGMPPHFPPHLPPPNSDSYSASEARSILRSLLVILVVYFVCLLIITYMYCIKSREGRPDDHQPTRYIWGNLRILSAGARIARTVVQVEAAAETVVYSSQGKRLVNEDCVICLASFENGEECKVHEDCRHVYHKECIDEWIWRDGHCPLCRVYARVVRRVNHHDLELGVLPFP